MIRLPKLSFILCLILFCLSANTYAEKYHPELNWQTLETEHFSFHFDASLEQYARGFTPKAELIHRYLTRFFNWTPEDKTHIVLTDHTYQTNAHASPVYYNKIVIYLSPPAEIASLEDFNDWFELVFLHEYVHIVHLDKTDGFIKHMRSVLGRHYLLFPNIFLPNWFAEGIATYLETDNELGIGRGQSSFFRSLMRLEVDNGIKPLGKVSQPLSDWPGGTSWYLYGVYFFQFIKERYGEEKLLELIEQHSSFPLPFVPSLPAWMATGKPYISLWREFEDYLEQRFEPEINALKKTEVSGDAITADGYRTGYSRTAANGDVYYIKDDNEDQMRLMRWQPASKKFHNMGQIYGNKFDLHPTRGILIPQHEFQDSINEYYDLYQIDLYTGEQRQLTRNSRYRYASWNPTGSQIAAAKTSRTHTQIDLLAFSGQYLDTLWEADNGEIIGSLDWSPNADMLVASVWRPEQGWNIELFTLDTQQWHPITQDGNITGQASFTKDGQHILFSADYNGVYNIFMYNLLTEETQQLTRVLGGAFYPDLSPDEKTLYYTELSHNGFDLHQLQWKQHQILDEIKPLRYNTTPRFEVTDSTSGNSYPSLPYNAALYSFPKWWLPTVLLSEHRNEIGFITSASDPLDWHTYNLNFNYEPHYQLPSWRFAYELNRYFPSLLVTHQRALNFYTDYDTGEINYIDKQDTFSMLLSAPYITNRFKINVFNAYVNDRLQVGYRSASSKTFPTLSDHLVSAGFIFNSLKTEQRSVVSHSGLRTKISLENSITEISNYSGKAMLIGGKIASPLILGTVFTLQGLEGRGELSTRRFTLTGGNTSAAEPSEFNPGTRDFKLRGYPAYLVSGRVGNRLQHVAAIWDIPLGFIERGLLTPPLGLMSLRASFFAEAGRAWYPDFQNTPPMLKSVGSELKIDLAVLYRIPLTLKYVIVKGLDEGGEMQQYLTIGQRY